MTDFHFGSSDVTSAAFNEGADWVGVLFSAYNLTSVFAAICIPMVVRHFNLRIAHMINLFLGGTGFISFLFHQRSNLTYYLYDRYRLSLGLLYYQFRTLF